MSKLLDKVKKYVADKDFDDGFLEDEFEDELEDDFDDEEETETQSFEMYEDGDEIVVCFDSKPSHKEEIDETEDFEEDEFEDSEEDKLEDSEEDKLEDSEEDEFEDSEEDEFEDSEEDEFEELEEIEEVDENDEADEENNSIKVSKSAKVDSKVNKSTKVDSKEADFDDEIDDDIDGEIDDDIDDEIDDDIDGEIDDDIEDNAYNDKKVLRKKDNQGDDFEDSVPQRQSSGKKSDKPTPAELIAAYYQEDEPVKKKKSSKKDKASKQEKGSKQENTSKQEKNSKQEKSSKRDKASKQDEFSEYEESFEQKNATNQKRYTNERIEQKPSYQDEEEDDATIRRRERRKRHIRNQILAYVITLVVLAVLGTGGYFGGRAIWDKVKPEPEVTAEEPSAVDEALNELAESEEEIVIEAPEVMNEEPEPTVEDYLEEIVEACISAMPLEDKVAQLFMVTPESLTGASKVTQAGEKTQEVLSQYRIGGFVYFGNNLVDKEQVTNMISATAGYNLYDMFFAIDEEGGEVARVQKSAIEVPEVGDMSEIGASGDTNQAYEAGKTIGQYLRELGFNVDFAPVADVVTDAEQSVIGDRSFGADATIVGQMVQKCAEGIQENDVSACLKHFPGLGDTTTDTHTERTVIEKSLEELQASDFVAFKDAIDAGVDFVMVSHATATGIDEVYPSSLSKKVITEQLREYLGYDGIVITDAMNMKAITEYYTTEEACVKAIKAGADMILMPADFEAGYNAVLEAVNDGTISEERIDESLKRIFRVKKRDEIVK